MKKILLVEDHQLFADGVTAMLENTGLYTVIAHLLNGLAAVEQAPSLQPDVILMDLDMPIMNGLDALLQLHPKMPETPIVILSMHAEKAVVQKAIQFGAMGYLLKNTPRQEFLRALEVISGGEKYYASMLTESLLAPETVGSQPQVSVKLLATLSEREMDVLRLLAEGLTSIEIGEKLHISPRTVDSHRKSLLQKLSAKNVAGLVRIAFREGLVK